MLAAGAAGVRMGTRFVATVESGAHPDYKDAIVAATGADTALVTDFSVLWPEGPRPHRVLRRALEAAHALDTDTVGEALLFGERLPVPKFAVVPPTADTTGTIEAFAMYAGMSVGSIDRIEPVADLVARLARDAADHLSQVAGGGSGADQ
jgi:NAD(P)H-dependent flavin oxidoreductase YrpB (nitropropane dioxygenase family)